MGIDWASKRRLRFGDSSALTLISFSRSADHRGPCRSGGSGHASRWTRGRVGRTRHTTATAIASRRRSRLTASRKIPLVVTVGKGADSWHNNGMTRTRVSTTVNEDLLSSARRLRSGLTDAALIDEALEALLARQRSAEIDASYAVYEEHPLDESDEWGNLAEFRQAAAAS